MIPAFTPFLVVMTVVYWRARRSAAFQLPR
jgi:hypothetical protein